MTLIPHTTGRTPSPTPTYDLADRYRPGGRRVLLTGVQAVARLLVEQQQRDARAGRRVAHLVSGYPGSPLGGLDKLLGSLPHLRTEHDVHLVPGLNEELGATAVWGSQLDLPGGKNVDSVVGVWYGKGPGVDRACDALRHGNVYGAHPDGGVLVLAGDDPGAKSSSLPCVSERTLASLQMPVVTPRDAQELVAFGLHGVALSRLSGCWTGVKVLADVADGLFTVERDFADVQIHVPELEWEGRPWRYRQRVFASPPDSLFAEQDLFGPRWAAVEAYRDANDLDAVEVDTPDAWLCVIATGTAYDAVRQALRELGMDDAALSRAGVRLLRIGMPFPLSGPKVRRAARGVRDVLVVEEKVAFVEEQVKAALYAVGAPRVFGKLDDRGRRLVPADGQLTADRLLPVLRQVLGQEVVLPDAPARPRTQLSLTPVSSARRTPYFCSGCPHNRSTVVPEGSLSGGGIGCHALVTMAGRETAQVTGLTQMGGEGVQWIGQAPFAADHSHIFQNVGDGTYFHSGQLALQACLAAGVTMTYKILYNSAVAMTGAQDAQGALTVPQLTHKLVAEGVQRVVVVADDVRKYGRRPGFAKGVEVRHRDDLDAVQRELREVPGVTVIVYDQHCAAEARRLRKRGKMPVRTQRVVIDEQVCEGCGDCGQKSNCLSVQPVETEFGRKTRIDQTSCNTDYSCLDGDCPSFLTVEVAADAKKTRREVPAPPSVAEPVLPAVGEGFDVLMAGIGGTGIVTVNQVLATAALLDGLTPVGLDQTGLSQKAGPVTSHLRLGTSSAPVNRLSPGTAGCVLAFDLLVASDGKQLKLSSPARTVTVASTSVTPTGDEVYDPSAAHPDSGRLLQALEQASRSLTTMDALGDAEALLGSTASANLLLVGAAYQAGALPVSAAAIERALEINGVAVQANVTAFRWGRVAVADPVAYRDAVRPAAAATRQASAVAARALELVGETPLEGETHRLALVRTESLLGWQGEKVARRYLDVVVRAWQAERALGDRTDYSQAVARGVHHVTAYKDEYEVARLLSRPELLDQVRAEVPGATSVTYRLHPPALRSMGLDRKLALPARVRPGLKALSYGKVLRGTPLDPFGRAHVRRVERELAAQHTALVEQQTAALSADSYDRAVALAAAAEQVRGYEQVKLRNVEAYRETVRALLTS
ncbi:MAG TPA: indolepyruvate ferredoxin oxidoreductase family protein [Mycobacteriales bacterium]|nr:indolepyruvate ferredoxin oxidoreductase family protein [Mycobacteriales bacterium]